MSHYPHKEAFFEMVRFDFVLDENLNVFLMEANMSPNLSSAHFPANKLLYEQVIHSVLKLVGVVQGSIRQRVVQSLIRQRVVQGSIRQRVVQGSIRQKVVQGSIRQRVVQGSIRQKEVQVSIRQKGQSRAQSGRRDSLGLNQVEEVVQDSIFLTKQNREISLEIL